MSIEENIVKLTAAVEALTAAINGAGKVATNVNNQATTAATSSAAVPAEKPARTRAPKAEAKPEPAPTEEPAAQAEADDGLGGDDGLGDEPTTLTLEDVRKKLFAVRDSVSRSQAGVILGAIGAKSIDTIPAEKFAEVVKLCDAALAKK